MSAPGSRRAALLLVPGLLLFFAYAAALWAIPQGPAEFAYYPYSPEPLPWAPMRGFTFEQAAAHVIRILLGTPALLLLSFAAARLIRVEPPMERTLRRLTLGLAAASLITCAFVMIVVLQGRAIFDDELTYALQARLLAMGRIAIADVPGDISELFTITTPLGHTGKYLFGEPLVQVPGVLIGIPALMHLPIAALTLWAIFAAVRRLAEVRTACWATMAVACSPMFILTSATGSSQATSLLCVAGMLVGYQLIRDGQLARGAAIVGTAIGFGLTVRIQVAMPVGAVVGSAALVRLLGARSWRSALILSITAGIWLAAILAYDTALTGSPLKLPWFLVEPSEHFGFGKVWRDLDYRHTPLKALANLAVTGVRLNEWWLGWPSSLVLLAVWLRLGRPMRGAAVWMLVALATLLFEAGYYSTGVSDTGTMYHYELLVPGALLAAYTIVGALDRWPRLTTAALLVNFSLGTVLTVHYESARIGRLVSAIHDHMDAALAQVPDHALLLHEADCRESLAVGWVHSRFPRRYRSPSDRIVTYPRPPPDFIWDYFRAYSDRACYYLRVEPVTRELELRKCEEAWDLIMREPEDPETCLAVEPTARRLGLYKGFGLAHAEKERMNAHPYLLQ
jgi:hypothetical protein